MSTPVAENLRRAREENIFGKASRSRVEDILQIFRQRYLVEEPVTQALVTLVRTGISNEILDRILFFHATRSDALLHDAVTELLLNRFRQGRLDISTADAQLWVQAQAKAGMTQGHWSEDTAERIAQGLLSTLRDFGLLQGTTRKKITSVLLPTQSFAYIAFYLQQQQPSGRLLLEDPEWQLFFLSRSAVERFFVEAQQQHLLIYHAAGSVVRITFPAENLPEYAHVIVGRTN